MNNLGLEFWVYVSILLGGVLGHLLLRRSGDAGRFFLNNIGEAGTGAGAGDGGAGAGDGGKGGKPVTFSPEQQAAVDHIVQERLSREKSKYADYDDLKKFKTDAEKQNDAKAQKELEDSKKYDEAKKGYENKIGELSNKLNEKDQAIQDRDIRHALTMEISKANGFLEESIALLRGMAAVDANGNVVIKVKDKNQVEQTLSVAEGVKNFLTERPHLVKSNHKAGSGSGAGDGAGAGGGGAGGAGGETLSSLNAELAQAINRGDQKRAAELKPKIRALMQGKGVSV